MSEENTSCCAGPGYASPQDAIKAPREQDCLHNLYLYRNRIEKPDYLATIDVDENSSTYGEIIHRTEVGSLGMSLHHMGWNACSSCNTDGSMERKYLIVPGVRTSNFYIVDTATDPRKPRFLKRLVAKRSRKKQTCLHLIRCTALVLTLLYQCWGMPRAMHPEDICI